jgi:hypothetical protein
MHGSEKPLKNTTMRVEPFEVGLIETQQCALPNIPEPQLLNAICYADPTKGGRFDWVQILEHSF